MTKKTSFLSYRAPDDSLRDLVSLVGAALNHELGRKGDPKPVTIQRDLSRVARDHRLEGFLLRHKAALRLPPSLIESLESQALNRAQQGLHQWASSIALSRLLSSNGFPHLIFKGRALTAQTFADEDSRGGGDVDVLVEPADVPFVHLLLQSHGYLPVYALLPRTALGWAFVTYRNREMPYRSERVEVDLHWRIATEPDLLPPTSGLLKRKVVVGRIGQEIPTLSPTDALAACAVHFYLDYAVSLRRLVDFVRLFQLATPKGLEELPARSRQLIADVAASCNQLFEGILRDLPGLPRAKGANVQYIGELFWAANGGFSHYRPEGGGLQRFSRNLSHLGRYASAPRLMARLLARGLVWFPPRSPQQKTVGIGKAFLLQARRLLRGQFDSQV